MACDGDLFSVTRCTGEKISVLVVDAVKALPDPELKTMFEPALTTGPLTGFLMAPCQQQLET